MASTFPKSQQKDSATLVLDATHIDIPTNLSTQETRVSIFCEKQYSDSCFQAMKKYFLESMFSPGKDRGNFATLAIITICTALFFFMCGDYRSYVEQNVADETIKSVHGFKAFSSWMTKDGMWFDHDTEKWSFSSDYLLLWGVRHLPSMEGNVELYRWVASFFIHANFSHILANLTVFFLVSSHLERKQGTVRVLMVLFLSHLIGSFSSAMFEDPSAVVMGSSGGVFGITGFYIVQWIVNFRRAFEKLLALFLGIFMIEYLCVAFFLCEETISTVSHLGGFISGLMFSYVIMLRRSPTYKEIVIMMSCALLLIFYLCASIYIINTMNI